MPRIIDLVGARKLRPVMKRKNLSIELVPDNVALTVSRAYNGYRRAKVCVGRPVWQLDNGVTIR